MSATAVDFILPTPIAPREAAHMLVEGQHVVVLSSAEIPEHRSLIIALARAMGSHLCLLRLQPRRRPAAATLSFTQSGDEAPACDLVFFQDDPTSRAIFDLVVFSRSGALTIMEMARVEKLLGTGTAPILTLVAPAG